MRAHILSICFLVTIALFGSFTESAPVPSTYQTLPHVPGYVPVYIRKGDTPLEEINLELAEAFGIIVGDNQRKTLDNKSDNKNEEAEAKPHINNVALEKNIKNEIN